MSTRGIVIVAGLVVLMVGGICCGGRQVQSTESGGREVSHEDDCAGPGVEVNSAPEERPSDKTVSGSFTKAGVTEFVQVQRVVLPQSEQNPDCVLGTYCGSINCRADIIISNAQGERITIVELERLPEDGEGMLDYHLQRSVPLGATGRDGIAIVREEGYHDELVMTMLIVQLESDSARILWQSSRDGRLNEEGEHMLASTEVESASPEGITIVGRGLDESGDVLETSHHTLIYREGSIQEN